MTEPKIRPFADGGFICVGTGDIREAQGYLVEYLLDQDGSYWPAISVEDRAEAEEIAYSYPAEVQFGKIAPVDRALHEAEGWSWQWLRDFTPERPKGHSVAVAFVR